MLYPRKLNCFVSCSGSHVKINYSFKCRIYPPFRKLSTNKPIDPPPKAKMRWFYAVDVPNSKPGWNKYTKTKEPEKFIPFSEWDSFNLEVNFRKKSTIPVEVNEDRLFEVDLQKLELAPVYWEGPIYEVRRGVWFDSNGIPFSKKQTEELEQGYKKVKPYTFKHEKPDTDSKENKEIISKFNKYIKEVEDGTQKVDLSQEKDILKLESGNYVMYLDGKNAVTFSADYDTNFQIDVIRQFSSTSTVPLIGVNSIQRGYSDDIGESIFDKLSTNAIPTIADSFQDEFGSILGFDQAITREKNETETKTETKTEAKTETENEIDDHHMQQYLEGDYDHSVSKNESNREIDHLIFCIHGIGQVLGKKYESINFTHNINVLRNTMKKVYTENDQYKKLAYPIADKKDETYNTNNRIQVLPITWRHKIGFNPEETVKDHDPRLPTLSQINVDGIRALRNVVGDVVLDVLLYYEPKYLKEILMATSTELNRVYKLYKERNPNFSGRIHVLGHSLGSAIAFDLLSGQTGTAHGDIELSNKLDFQVDSLFLAGSPVGLFKLLEGKNITAAFDDKVVNNNGKNLDKVAAPNCRNLYNIFHPCDPVAYRIEPLINPQFGNFKAEQIAFASRGISTHIQELYSYGDGITGKISQATKWLRGATKSESSPQSKSIEESASEENALGDIITSIIVDEKKQESNKVTKRNMTDDELIELLALNNTGRVDYCLPMGVLDFSLVSAVSAHISYFENQDTSGFIMKELLEGRDDPVRKKFVSLY